MEKHLFYCLAVLIMAAVSACSGNRTEKNNNEVPADAVRVCKDTPITDGVSVFAEGGLFGVKNTKGSFILQPEYANVYHYNSELCDDEEFAFWRDSTSTDKLPDAEVICDRMNLLLRKGNLSGIFSRQGEELLAVKYPEIYTMAAAGSYSVTLIDGTISVWKGGRFIINGYDGIFYGTDLEKQKYVFSNEEGTLWDFYDFDGKGHCRLTLPAAPKGVCLPQYLEPGRFLVDNAIVNAGGKILLQFPKWTEVCGNFLLVPAGDDKYDVFSNTGKKLATGVDMAYMVTAEDIPHLPTGEIVVEKDGRFSFYNRLGKYQKNVPGVIQVWAFAELTAQDREGGVLVYSDYE